jgi:hypothetical protein
VGDSGQRRRLLGIPSKLKITVSKAVVSIFKEYLKSGEIACSGVEGCRTIYKIWLFYNCLGANDQSLNKPENTVV